MKQSIRLFIFSIALMLGALINVARADSTLIKLSPAKANTEVLFVLLSQQASIHAIPNKSGTYELSLRGVNPKVIYFSDRPERLSKQISTHQFIQQWKSGAFKSSPPNAVMEAVRLNLATKQLQKGESSYPIILMNPVYHTKTNRLSFEIKALPGSKIALPTSAKSDYVDIFIDGVCLTCIGG